MCLSHEHIYRVCMLEARFRRLTAGGRHGELINSCLRGDGFGNQDRNSWQAPGVFEILARESDSE